MKLSATEVCWATHEIRVYDFLELTRGGHHDRPNDIGHHRGQHVRTKQLALICILDNISNFYGMCHVIHIREAILL